MPEWDAIHADDFKLAIAMDSGDEETVNQMLFEQKRDMVEEALKSNFDTSIKTSGEIAERGKLQAKAKKIHNMSTSPESINGYLMTFDAMKYGLEKFGINISPASVAALFRSVCRGTFSEEEVDHALVRGSKKGVDFRRFIKAWIKDETCSPHSYSCFR